MASINELANFFAKAGKVVDSGVREEGEFPKVKYTAWWTYEKGASATFDGQDWKLKGAQNDRRG